METEDDVMTAPEVARLIEWLKTHGHTPEEIEQCIRYIAGFPVK